MWLIRVCLTATGENTHVCLILYFYLRDVAESTQVYLLMRSIYIYLKASSYSAGKNIEYKMFDEITKYNTLW